MMPPPRTSALLANRFRELGKLVEANRQNTLAESPRMMRSILASAEAEAHAAQLTQQANHRYREATKENHSGDGDGSASQVYSVVSGRTYTLSTDGVLSI